MAQKKTSSPAKWIIITVVLVILIAVAVVAAGSLSRKNQKPKLDLSHIKLKEDIIFFTYKTLPNLYSGLFRLNSEIDLIDKERERLKEIEAEFPQQKKIISVESSNWNRVQNGLSTALSHIEKDIEKIYVTHLVNKAKAKELIDNKTETLTTAIKEALEASKPHTNRLKVVKKKTAVDKLKEKIFS